MRSSHLTVICLATCLSTSASGTTLICSHPDRAGIKSKAVVSLPTDNIDMLDRRFGWTAARIGMSTWGVGASERGRVTSRTLGMQSPKVSVSISAEWKPGQRAAKLVVERTCYTDDLEPWLPYWRAFLAELRRAGYQVRVSQAAI